MKQSQIKRILTGAGYKEDERFQCPEINTLILSTNQGINHLKEFLTFDSTNEMIFIKKYNCKLISGKFSKNIKIDGSCISSITQFPAVIKPQAFRYPLPKDKLLIVKKDDSVVDTGLEIITNGNMNIWLSGNFNSDLYNPSEDELVYVDPTDYPNSIKNKKFRTSFIVYKEDTQNPEDIYLDVDELVGIKMQCEVNN